MRAVTIGFVVGVSTILPAPAAGVPVKQSLVCEIPVHPSYDEKWPGGTVDISIHANGELRWRGLLVDQATFAEYVATAAKNRVKPIFNVRVEPNTKFSTLLPVLNRIQSAGIRFMMLGDTISGIPEQLPIP